MRKLGPYQIVVHFSAVAMLLGVGAVAVSGQVAGVATMSAQQAAVSQLSGVNQQIKNKDDVTFGYGMLQTG
jgi:hypothetical protein